MDLLLKPGERGIIIGQTGSGKTVGAISQLQHTPATPVVIFDTKGETGFDKIAVDEEVEFFDSLSDFESAWFKKSRKPTFLVVRPDVTELAEPEIIDDTLYQMILKPRACCIYIDEGYQLHVRGQAGKGLIGILTRGRSKKITTLIGTQRPAWLSRFCFTEAQKMYIYRLSDRRDMKTLAEYIPDFDDCKQPEKHHFYFYDVGAGKLSLCKPVKILEKPVTGKVGRPARTWI